MSKLNKTQINHILFRLRGAVPHRYDVKKNLAEKYTPKKPACVTKYEEKVVAAKQRAEKEAYETYQKRMEFIRKVEDDLVLGTTDVNVSDLIKQLEAIK